MKMVKRTLKTWINNNQEIKDKMMKNECNKKPYKKWMLNNNK